MKKGTTLESFGAAAASKCTESFLETQCYLNRSSDVGPVSAPEFSNSS